MREQFTFYRSFFSAISEISSRRDKLSIYEAIANYALDGREIEMTDTAKALFLLVKPTLDAAARKSEGRRNRARSDQDNGKIPSRPAQDVRKEGERENKRENEKESYVLGDFAKSPDTTDAEKEKNKRFTKPTVEEIAAYCKERNNGVDPSRFYNFYEAKGWRIGKSPMKDWRAAVRTWERKDERGNENGKNPAGRAVDRGGHSAEYWGVESIDLDR